MCAHSTHKSILYGTVHVEVHQAEKFVTFLYRGTNLLMVKKKKVCHFVIHFFFIDDVERTQGTVKLLSDLGCASPSYAQHSRAREREGSQTRTEEHIRNLPLGL